jgi:hypothetical protein
MRTCKRCYADCDPGGSVCRTCGGKEFVELVDDAMLRMQCGEDDSAFELRARLNIMSSTPDRR